MAAGEERQSHNTYTEDVQDNSSMSPVLVGEDVIGELMESCKKQGEGERKLRCLISSSHPPHELLSSTERGCPTQPCLPQALPHLPGAQLTLSSGTTFPKFYCAIPCCGQHHPVTHRCSPRAQHGSFLEGSTQSRCNISWRGWQLSSHCPAIHRTSERSTASTSQPVLQMQCCKSLKDKFPPFAQMPYYCSGC